MKTIKEGWAIAFLAVAMVLVVIGTASSSRAGFEKDIVISQVYGGGGLSGAQYASDYIELYNRGTQNISLDYMSIQYATAAGNFDQAIQLDGYIDPGQFYVIKCHTGTIGAEIYNGRVTSDLDIDAESGKIALVDAHDPLNCDNATTCMPAQLLYIVDMVGWGTAEFYEGSAPAPAGSATTALLRTGCQDHDNNTADFAAAAPTPSTNSNLPCRRLTISKSGTGTGMVTASPPDIICGDTCTIFVNDGATVLLKAATCCNSQFDGWSGGCSGTDNCTMTMTGDASVTATFSTLPVYEVGDAGDSCAAAQNAAFNSIIEGTLSNTDDDINDYYRFVVTEPTDVVLYETGPDHGNFGGRLYTSSCVRIGGTETNLPKTATLSPGTYYASITTYGSGLLTYNLHIAPAGKITGRVTDESGQGVGNLLVSAGLMYGGYSSSARTIDNGTYTITGLPAELYVVDFIPNYSPAEGQNYFEESYNDRLDHYQADLLWVVEGQTVSGIDAQLRTAGEITGRVTNAQGQPIAGITVELYSEGETYELKHCMTDDNGTYSFVVLTTGSYNVRFVPGYEQNYLAEWYSGRDNQTAANSIAVTACRTTAGINAQLEAGGSITGRLTGAGGLVPISYKSIFVEGEGAYSKSVSTKSDGTYSIYGLETGFYTVRAEVSIFEHSNCSPLNEYYNDSVSVTAGQTTSGIDIDISAINAIAGRVSDAAGAGIEGIKITASGGMVGDYETYSSDNGSYGMYLPEGEYTVYFNGNGVYRNEWYNNKFQPLLANTVSVLCGQPATGIHTQLTAIAGGISGRVTGPDNASLEGVTVRVYDLSYNLAGTAVTNSLGGYIIGLQEGSYKLYVPGFGDDSTCYAGQWYSGKAGFEAADPVPVAFGQITGDIDLQFASSLCASIQGTITADGGTVPGGLEVKIVDLSNNLVTNGTTNSSGSYEIKVVPGSYKIYFAPWNGYGGQWYSAKTSFAAADTVSVAAGETADGIDADLQYSGDPCGDIQGRVTSGGFGVPNAGVRAYDENENEVATAEGDPYGNYVLSCVPAGNYKIYFERGGIFVPEYYNNATSFEQADLVPVNVGETTGNIDADLSTPFGVVQGRVLDYYGNGLPDTNVVAYDQDGSFALYGRTDPDGNYAMVGLPEGDYRMYFEPVDGRHMGEYFDNKQNITGADPVSVHNGQTTPNIDAQLSLGGAISGRMVNPVGDPLSGNIYIIDVATHATRLVRTGDNGTYVAAGLIPGKYRVKFEADAEVYAPEYYNDKATYELADNITIAIADNITSINAQLAVGGAIHGRVTAGGYGAPDARVSVYNQEGFIRDTITQSDGYFTLSGLVSGQYKVKFDCYDVYLKEWYNNRASFETADEIAVTVGLTAEIGTVSLAEGLCGGTIEGRVTDELGSPLQFITVIVYDEWANEVANVETAGDGTYSTDSIEGGVLQEGQYKVQFADYSTNEFLSEFYNDAPDSNSAVYVSVYDGQATSNINAQLARPGKISGTVKGPDNQTLSGIHVGAYTPGNEHIVSSAATETDGRYTISNLRSGNYKVRFSDASGTNVPQWYDGKESFAAADNVSATSGQETSGIDARLSAYGRITGRVTYAGGSGGIPDVRVYIYDSDMNPVQAGTAFITDAEGAYSIGKLATGMYRVFFSSPVNKWYNNRATSGEADLVSVTMGSTTSGINAQFAASGISGRVTNSLGHSVAGATVWAFTETENYTAITADDGRYAVLVPPDAYRVAFGNLNTWYDGKDSYDNADTVVVQAEQMTANIDGQAPDGKISGRVSYICQDDSGVASVAGATVTAFDSSGKAQGTDVTDNTTGKYEITLPMGETYKVLFVYPHNFVEESISCSGSDLCSSWDYYEWYEKHLTYDEATDVAVSHFGSRNINSDYYIGVNPCSRISTTTTSIRYDSQDTTVTDYDTGLEWFKDANHFVEPLAWEDAVEAVNRLNSADGGDGIYGHSDWRLPTRDEFATIIDTNQSDPALVLGQPFDNVQNDRYWSSTTRSSTSNNSAYRVHLGTGNIDYESKDMEFFVWPVRSTLGSSFKTLKVTKTGRGKGQVMSLAVSSKIEVVCDPVCYTTFIEGPSVILRADPDDSMVFAGNSAWTGCDSFTTDNACIVDMEEPREIEVRFDNPYNITVNPKAIIVAGSGPYIGNNLWDATQALTIYAYNELLSQELTGDSIYYMTFNPPVDADGDTINDCDNESNNEHLEHAITGWAADADSLVIYLMGHGIDGQFEINGVTGEFLAADDLRQWLDDLQIATGMPVVVVYEACYSGSFLPLLVPGPGAEAVVRMVVASADEDEKAWFDMNGMVSFSRYFWMAVQDGKTVDQCFLTGRDGMAVPGYQNALLDADLNGLDTGGADIGEASHYKIGKGLVPAGVEPAVGTVMPEKRLYGDNATAEIWASDMTPPGTVSFVWAVIREPGIGAEIDERAIVDLTTVELNKPFGEVQYKATHSGFGESGVYNLAVYLMDISGALSQPTVTRVIKDVDDYEQDDTAGQAKPVVVNSGKPQYHNFWDSGDEDWVKFYGVPGATGSQLYTISLFDQSPRCDAVVELYGPDNSSKFITEIDIDNGTGWLCDTAGMYYVKVFQADGLSYGTYTNYHLLVWNPDAPVLGLIKGSIRDTRGSAVASAVITTDGGYSALGSNGAYEMPHKGGGPYTLEAEADGYQPYSQSGINLKDRETLPFNIVMTPIGGATTTTTVPEGETTTTTAAVTTSSSTTTIRRLCPARQALGDGSEAELEALRVFRDKRLNQSAEGVKMVGLYYRHAAELTAMFERKPEIAAQVREMVLELLPQLGGQQKLVLSQDMKQQILDLINQIRTDASPGLKKSLLLVRKKIEKGYLELK